MPSAMGTERTTILDHDKVQRKLQRIAHQLHEEHHHRSRIVIVGVKDRGAQVAESLCKLLKDIAAFKVHSVDLTLNKDEPHAGEITLSVPLEELKGEFVVLVDDVLMSGRTLMHAAAFLLQVPLKGLTTVVLVDRRHRTFPIRADIVGLTLSTTLQEHIHVELGKKCAVHLS